MKKTQLLAPAGNMECLKAAFCAGADAVYLGGQRFGARAFAGNFSDEELIEAIKLAAFFEKKIYLTVNTLMKEEELKELPFWLSPLYEAGLHGVIIQDLGALSLCRAHFPGLALHASTQMTVTESGAALFLKELGVSRIVPARELSLEEIAGMKRETGMELEVFIHGAMCYCYSGQCLFSSMLGGRSGNRGRCAQPCRQPYSIKGPRRASKSGLPAGRPGHGESYPLSLKDMCVLPFLDKLLAAGVDSLKIEGRMKSPEYVAGVTAAYRKYMDLYEKNPAGFSVGKSDLEFLEKLYIRSEISGGYYGKHNGREMVTLDKPGYTGASQEACAKLRETYLTNGMTRSVNLSAVLKKGEPAVLRAECGRFSISQSGMTVGEAKNKPLTREAVEKQLMKTGGSGFHVQTAEIDMQEDVFLPVSALNELRRQALSGLRERMVSEIARRGRGVGSGEAVCAKKPFPVRFSSRQPDIRPASHGTALRVSARTAAQALAALSEPAVKRLYLTADAVLCENTKKAPGGFKDGRLKELLETVGDRRAGDGEFTFYLSLPVILRSYSEKYMEQLGNWLETSPWGKLVDGLQAGGLSGLTGASHMGWKKGLAVNHTAYVWNPESLALYENAFQIDTYTAPLELNAGQIRRLPAKKQELMVYGRIPMMITANCVKKTSDLCGVRHTRESLNAGKWEQSMDYFLEDRFQTCFPVLVNCRHCMNTIYNSVPLSLHPHLAEIRDMRPQGVRLDFTDELPDRAYAITAYFAGRAGGPPASYTTGHYKKGAQ